MRRRVVRDALLGVFHARPIVGEGAVGMGRSTRSAPFPPDDGQRHTTEPLQTCIPALFHQPKPG